MRRFSSGRHSWPGVVWRPSWAAQYDEVNMPAGISSSHALSTCPGVSGNGAGMPQPSG